ncbi:hypothetical protein DSO57_1017163 [Entomophthora muscae]|uniref:Uncharacterized protein n=1 Tax=Entomophthora muscae TaxID=34485 RepID=A0ACC2RVW3_9FUNG|nr:hypothetical protein DSO57_1017163 [Entomophthora muscae]
MYSPLIFVLVTLVLGQEFPDISSDVVPIGFNLPDVANESDLIKSVVGMKLSKCQGDPCFSTSAGTKDRQTGIPLPSLLDFITKSHEKTEALLKNGVAYANITTTKDRYCSFASTPTFSFHKSINIDEKLVVSIDSWNTIVSVFKQIDSVNSSTISHYKLSSENKKSLLDVLGSALPYLNKEAAKDCSPRVKLVGLACHSYPFEATYVDSKGEHTIHNPSEDSVLLPNFDATGKYFTAIVDCKKRN